MLPGTGAPTSRSIRVVLVVLLSAFFSCFSMRPDSRDCHFHHPMRFARNFYLPWRCVVGAVFVEVHRLSGLISCTYISFTYFLGDAAHPFLTSFGAAFF